MAARRGVARGARVLAAGVRAYRSLMAGWSGGFAGGDTVDEAFDASWVVAAEFDGQVLVGCVLVGDLAASALDR